MWSCKANRRFVVDIYTEYLINTLLMFILAAVLYVVIMVAAITVGNWMANVLERPQANATRRILIIVINLIRDVLNVRVHDELPVTPMVFMLIVIIIIIIVFNFGWNFLRCIQI